MRFSLVGGAGYAPAFFDDLRSGGSDSKLSDLASNAHR